MDVVYFFPFSLSFSGGGEEVEDDVEDDVEVSREWRRKRRAGKGEGRDGKIGHRDRS
jgi:hypothetical protein